MKKLSAFIIFCMLLVSCDFLIDDTLLEGDKGNLTFILRDDGVEPRSLDPDISMDIHHYDIRGSNFIGESFTKNGLMVGSNHTEYDLSIGEWQITVEAKNISGTVIGRGETSKTVKKDQTVTAEVLISPITGQGILDLYITWPIGALSSPIVDANLVDSYGNSSFLEFSGSYEGNSASFYDYIDTGYYTLTIDLLDGYNLVWSYSDDIRIVSSGTTAATFNYASDKGIIDIDINTNMENPLEITLTGNMTSLSPGTDMTVYSDVSETPDSYQWYLNGELLYGETFSYITIGSDLEMGSHRLTLVVQKGDILSSEGFNFVISQAITLDVEVYSGYYGGEVSWYIVDSNGNEVASSEYYSSSSYYYSEIILAPGQYTIYGADSYGDGWNGGYVTITNNGVPVLDGFTFTSGSSAQADFTVGNTNFDVLGSWTLYFDWAPTDSYNSVSMSLNADNTFDTAGSYAGVWSLIGDQLVLTYDNGTEYTGTVQGSNYVSGTMVAFDGVLGIWYADR